MEAEYRHDRDDGVSTEHSIKRVKKYGNAETRKTRLQPVDIIQKICYK